MNWGPPAQQTDRLPTYLTGLRYGCYWLVLFFPHSRLLAFQPRLSSRKLYSQRSRPLCTYRLLCDLMVGNLFQASRWWGRRKEMSVCSAFCVTLPLMIPWNRVDGGHICPWNLYSFVPFDNRGKKTTNICVTTVASVTIIMSVHQTSPSFK